MPEITDKTENTLFEALKKKFHLKKGSFVDNEYIDKFGHHLIIRGSLDYEKRVKGNFVIENGHVISLSLWKKNVSALPESFGDLKFLQILELSDNQLTALPESFGQLEALQELWISKNQLTTLPRSFGNLKSLCKLNLNFNRLTDLPESFGQLQSLQELDLWSNQLSTLPEAIPQLKSLCDLGLSYNQLTALPESFGNLKSLQILQLSFNQLATLPVSFGQLQSLRTLELYSNKLTTLPRALGDLDRLEKLDLAQNPLLGEDKEIYERKEKEWLTAQETEWGSTPKNPLISVVSKECEHCGKPVPLQTKVGDTCPHCGIRFGGERQKNELCHWCGTPIKSAFRVEYLGGRRILYCSEKCYTQGQSDKYLFSWVNRTEMESQRLKAVIEYCKKKKESKLPLKHVKPSAKPPSKLPDEVKRKADELIRIIEVSTPLTPSPEMQQLLAGDGAPVYCEYCRQQLYFPRGGLLMISGRVGEERIMRMAKQCPKCHANLCFKCGSSIASVQGKSSTFACPFCNTFWSTSAATPTLPPAETPAATFVSRLRSQKVTQTPTLPPIATPAAAPTTTPTAAPAATLAVALAVTTVVCIQCGYRNPRNALGCEKCGASKIYLVPE